MSNLFAVHVVQEHEGHIHLSIHEGYDAAKEVAVELASSPEYDSEYYRTFVAPVTLGADITNLDGSEEILDAS